MDERDLERHLRAGLGDHADDADVDAPVIDRARAQVRHRRRARWGVAAAAAAAVVVIVGGVAALDRGEDAVEQLPIVTDPTGPASPELAGWRTEYWGSLAVDVPADWGYGGAPMLGGVVCSELSGPSGGRPAEDVPGYVGRPIATTDMCATYPWLENSPYENPTMPYVWLGAVVDPGTVEYDSGLVQETVAVEGTTLTVASEDRDLRRRILDSARAGDLCEPLQARVPHAESALTTEGRGGLLDARICVYRGGEGGPYPLVHAAALEPADAERALTAQEAAPEADVDCDRAPFEFVVLHATYDDPFGSDDLHRVAVFATDCGVVMLGEAPLADEPEIRQMVPRGVAPWADGGIAATIVGAGVGDWQYDYFIGIQG